MLRLSTNLCRRLLVVAGAAVLASCLPGCEPQLRAPASRLGAMAAVCVVLAAVLRCRRG
jgi:hypothetical protein